MIARRVDVPKAALERTAADARSAPREGPGVAVQDRPRRDGGPATLAVRVVCRPEVAPGFELAGVRVATAVDAAAARARITALAADPAVGIVLVEDRLHRALPADFAQRVERAARPLVATFPGPHLAAPEAAEEAVLEILRRAIGYRVRLP